MSWGNMRLIGMVEDTGMKIFETKESENEFPLCKEIAEEGTELFSVKNESGGTAVFSIKDTFLKYSVPDGGRFYMNYHRGGFVQTFSMVNCRDHCVVIRTGKQCFEIEDDGYKYWDEEYEPICKGPLRLDCSGAVFPGGYRYTRSGYGNPVVYVRNDTGIDSMGNVLLPYDRRHWYQIEQRLISADVQGELCITSDRRVLCRGRLTLEEADPAVGIAGCNRGYLVHTQCGDVYFSNNGSGWQLIGDLASAIAAYDDLVTWADIHGNVYVYKDGKQNLGCAAVLRFSGKYISEMDISRKLIALKFLDGTFAVLDWHTQEIIYYR